MRIRDRLGRIVGRAGVSGALLIAGFAVLATLTHEVQAFWPRRACPPAHTWEGPAHIHAHDPECGEWAGAWYWLRSPEQEKRVITSLYNRYCIRCHGVDGRGVWDIPCVPDFTNVRWQDCRSDAQLARIILEGRGAVMPAFRGTLTLEEAWAMARYLRTFVPGTETPRPDDREPEKPAEELPAPKPTPTNNTEAPDPLSSLPDLQP